MPLRVNTSAGAAKSVTQRPQQAPKRPSTGHSGLCASPLQALAGEGNAMGVKLAELPQINAALAAAQAWAKSAASAAAPPSLRATHAKRPALSLVRCCRGLHLLKTAAAY